MTAGARVRGTLLYILASNCEVRFAQRLSVVLTMDVTDNKQYGEGAHSTFLNWSNR